MITYQITVEYLGTNFVGWQFQKNGLSIQEVLESALSRYLKENIRVIGSGRTDSGVHASEQSAHFKTKNKINDMGIFLNAVNFFLKKHPVSILNIKKRSNSFHARHSAKERVYKYFIINRKSRPVLDSNRGWHIIKELDLIAMKKGAKKLVGTKDFSAFRASTCRAKSPIKTMKLIKIKSFDNKIEIEFRSQSFLQQQVRSMVGCLKYLGEKKWTIKKFESVIKLKKRTLCAPPAPPEGLYLKRVIY